MQTGERETGVVVIKSRVGPADLVMAGIASLREAGGEVIRNGATESGGVLPIGDVARIASRAVQAVVVANVALIAVGDHPGRGHLVIAAEGPTRRSMAPGSRRKRRCCGVAVGAICSNKRRACSRVHRIVGAAVIGGVATGVAAVTVQDAGQIVVAIDVTGCTGHAGMEAVENETSRAVVERRTRPAGGVVARAALRDGEARLIVDGVIRLLVRGQVTACVAAVRRLDVQRVVVIDMARGAGSGRGRNVHAGQGKTRHAVIERSQIGPGDGVVALRAVGGGKRSTGCGMHWIVCVAPIGLVTELVSAIGGRRGQVVAASGGSVALSALYVGVGIGEREAGSRVIECGARPARRVMAG